MEIRPYNGYTQVFASRGPSAASQKGFDRDQGIYVSCLPRAKQVLQDIRRRGAFISRGTEGENLVEKMMHSFH